MALAKRCKRMGSRYIQVEIFRRDEEIIIRENPTNLSRAFELLTQLPEDFFADSRKDSLPQKRDF